MKTPSYQIIGIGISVAAICAWLFFVEKEIEKYNGYYIWKIGGKFVAERLSDERKINPRFATIEQVKVWVDAQVLASKLKETVATAMPWG
jgi:hypothetical protein